MEDDQPRRLAYEVTGAQRRSGHVLRSLGVVSVEVDGTGAEGAVKDIGAAVDEAGVGPGSQAQPLTEAEQRALFGEDA